MGSDEKQHPPFSSWLRRPETMVGLSALLLSLCGLFIALFEASLIRRQQRASVWPHVEVTASMTDESVRLWVRNTGIGPARIRVAAVSWKGETAQGWKEILRQIGANPAETSRYHSLINGRVLPANSVEKIFAIPSEEEGPASDYAIALSQHILKGDVDVVVCYCSVYEECWISELQDVFKRSRDIDPGTAERTVEDCRATPRSNI